jgi:excinuclease ABC subunit C
VVLKIRGGRLLASETYYFADRDEPDAEVFDAFLAQYYNATTSIPAEILTSAEPEDPDLLVRWLSEKRGAPVAIAHPGAGDKRTLVELAQKNATLKLDEWVIAQGGASRRVPPAVVELGEALGTRDFPRRIECFDISNFHGSQPVASLVHFEAGEPVKKLYKHFRIRGVTAPNDFAMMEHVVERHYRGVRESGRPLPDLVLVDGGRGQLGAARRALDRLGLADRMALAGLAKRHEEIFRPGRAEPLVLERTSAALKLVQRVRDEAHRFAVGYHRKLRDRELVRSALDDIPGVGAKTRLALLRRFGSVAGVASASAAELATVPGVGAPTAERILKVLSHPALQPGSGAGSEHEVRSAPTEDDDGEEIDLDAAWLPEREGEPGTGGEEAS